jgi:hypothetical protein
VNGIVVSFVDDYNLCLSGLVQDVFPGVYGPETRKAQAVFGLEVPRRLTPLIEVSKGLLILPNV